MKQTKTELSAALRLSRKTVSKHLNKPGAPAPGADGRYNVAAVQRFIHGEQIANRGYATSDLLKAKVEKLTLESKRLRQQMNLSEASIPASKLTDLLWAFLNQCAAEWRSAINHTAHELAGKSAAELLTLLPRVMLLAQYNMIPWMQEHGVPLDRGRVESWPVDNHPSFAFGHRRWMERQAGAAT